MSLSSGRLKPFDFTPAKAHGNVNRIQRTLLQHEGEVKRYEQDLQQLQLGDINLLLRQLGWIEEKSEEKVSAPFQSLWFCTSKFSDDVRNTLQSAEGQAAIENIQSKIAHAQKEIIQYEQERKKLIDGVIGIGVHPARNAACEKLGADKARVQMQQLRAIHTLDEKIKGISLLIKKIDNDYRVIFKSIIKSIIEKFLEPREDLNKIKQELDFIKNLYEITEENKYFFFIALQREEVEKMNSLIASMTVEELEKWIKMLKEWDVEFKRYSQEEGQQQRNHLKDQLDEINTHLGKITEEVGYSEVSHKLSQQIGDTLSTIIEWEFFMSMTPTIPFFISKLERRRNAKLEENLREEKRGRAPILVKPATVLPIVPSASPISAEVEVKNSPPEEVNLSVSPRISPLPSISGDLAYSVRPKKSLISFLGGLLLLGLFCGTLLGPLAYLVWLQIWVHRQKAQNKNQVHPQYSPRYFQTRRTSISDLDEVTQSTTSVAAPKRDLNNPLR